MKPGEYQCEAVNDEERHELRLRALLHNLVRRKGRGQAARELGIDLRTLAACVEGESMSWRMREALERLALRDWERSAADRHRKGMEDLVQRVNSLETETRDGVEAMRGEIGVVRQELGTQIRQMERRLNRQEESRNAGVGAHGRQTAGGQEADAPAVQRHPEVVTMEPAPDDEELYGEAWPLVEEWRRLWADHSSKGRGLTWLVREERIRQLEVTMLEVHGLTLPPETEPLRGLWRRSQINWRKKTFRDVRRARARREFLREVRRALTLNLWWD